jgi:hypothetical protein
MFYKYIIKPIIKTYLKINDLLPLETSVYIITAKYNINITIYYYLLILFYYININVFNYKNNYLIYLKNDKKIIYENISINEIIKNNRLLNNNNNNKLKKSFLLLKIYINNKLIDYNTKKLIFSHDDNNTLEQIFKAHHLEKIENIIVNNKEYNNIQVKYLRIN